MHIQVLYARTTELKQMQSKIKLPGQHGSSGQQHYFSLFISHINCIYYNAINGHMGLITLIVRWAQGGGTEHQKCLV